MMCCVVFRTFTSFTSSAVYM